MKKSTTAESLNVDGLVRKSGKYLVPIEILVVRGAKKILGPTIFLADQTRYIYLLGGGDSPYAHSPDQESELNTPS